MAVPKLKVTYLDGTVKTALVGPKQQVALERQFGISVDEAKNAEHLYFLAYIGLSQKGEETRQFDDFLDVIAEVDEIEEDTDELDPTPPAQSPEDSSV